MNAEKMYLISYLCGLYVKYEYSYMHNTNLYLHF